MGKKKKNNRKWCEELEVIVIVQVNCNNSYDNGIVTWNSSSGEKPVSKEIRIKSWDNYGS